MDLAIQQLSLVRLHTNHPPNQIQKGTPVKVLIKFSLFIHQEQKIQEYLGFRNQKQILVEYRLNSFSDFQNWVAVACKTAFENTGSIITKNKFHVDSHSVSVNWLKKAVKTGKSDVNLTLTMPNPSEMIKQAEKEDLLAAHVPTKKQSKRLQKSKNLRQEKMIKRIWMMRNLKRWTGNASAPT
ncbi:hypothetical protein VP01_4380g1 [Puccinia sorghi]|uniref:Uncharacterized protein n=1 Tax=Puccinia sorghi TaxID=27349 RepID=A0A0L6UPP3_9BASI|nr:hypothetical protein VP01_4380g1 [Puccinia sorghi]